MAATSLESLPNEVLYDIILYLPVFDLVAAQNVSRRWRALVNASKPHIHPTRRELLELYNRSSPLPPSAGPWHFWDIFKDHQSLTQADLVELIDASPYQWAEDFVLWAREWPCTSRGTAWLRTTFKFGCPGRKKNPHMLSLGGLAGETFGVVQGEAGANGSSVTIFRKGLAKHWDGSWAAFLAGGGGTVERSFVEVL